MVSENVNREKIIKLTLISSAPTFSLFHWMEEMHLIVETNQGELGPAGAGAGAEAEAAAAAAAELAELAEEEVD